MARIIDTVEYTSSGYERWPELQFEADLTAAEYTSSGYERWPERCILYTAVLSEYTSSGYERWPEHGLSVMVGDW